MAGNNKLPLSLQLVGVTAVLVFCFSAISAVNYGRGIWLNREVVASLDNQFEVFAPVLLRILVCTTSAAMFVMLLARSVRVAALSSIVYLIFLLLLLGWQLVPFAMYGRWAMPMFAAFIGVKLLYATWLLGLLVKVWPNYSLKRTAANRLDVD
jgi:hypothetical protein